MDRFINFLKTSLIKYQLRKDDCRISGIKRFIARFSAGFYSSLLALELEVKLPRIIDRRKSFLLRVVMKLFYLPVAAFRVAFLKRLNLLQVGLIVTTRCSLNCRYCGDWIQYIKDRRDFELADLLADIDSVAGLADYIYNFDLLGGEPLMRKDIAEIVNHASEKANIGNVRIITNGTIVPSDEILAKMDKTKLVFRISNYGSHSARLDELAAALKRHGIRFFAFGLSAWSDLGAPRLRHYNEEELHQNLLTCLKREATNLFDGTLYPCANIHMGMLIGAIPDNPNDYVKIRGCNQPEERLVIRRQLRTMLRRIGFTACNYCSGCGPGRPAIPIAEQLPRDAYIDYQTGEVKKRSDH